MSDRADADSTGVCAAIDVTEVRAAEAALQETQSELARVTRVTSLGELASSIAHEGLQPLSAIITTGEASVRWLLRPRPIVKEARQGLEQNACRCRAVEIVNRVRRKDEAGKAALDINQALEDALALVRGAILRRGVSLRPELESGLPAVRGDRVQLQQVVINLILNGVQAMEGINKERVLALRTKSYGDGHVVVEVEDRGHGH